MTEPGKGRGRSTPWPIGDRGQRLHWAWPAAWPATARSARDIVRNWALADVGPGRLMPWLAVAFGCGIVLYFAADREPAVGAALALVGVSATAAVLARRRPIAFSVVLATAAVAAGFATVTVKRAIIAHPVLSAAAWNVEIAGFVEIREERERSDRIVVRVQRIAGPRLGEKPDRVRVAVRKGAAPPVGAFVEFKARLSPPLSPLRPGGYDFSRDLYFQRIGASGFVLGGIRTTQPPAAPGPRLRIASFVQGLRDAIDRRIRSVVPGDEGSIASALITGKRGAISTPVNEAMYVSSLGHVLSISGYHMAVVAGITFFALRAAMALVPAFAGRHPIKKWAALAALAAGAFYLVLSGAQVATQRSFIMVAVVLIGVMVDRAALTLRTLTIAAFCVLLLSPEAIVHPGFQMSFAATLALIAGYERGLPWLTARADTPLGARVALWGGREVIGLLLVSLLAGTATTLYAAYHFHRLAPYGVLANLLAMPVVSLWVMPTGILGLLMLPFGFDGFFWRVMGEGIGWMVAVALWVAALPGAVGRIAAFGTGPLLLATAGLIVICLLKSPLRIAGALLIAVAVLWAIRTPQPDVLISADGANIAIRTASGQLAMIKAGGDDFAFREWLATDGDPRTPKDESLGKGIACDHAGCIGRLADGSLVALAQTIEAFEEDCRRAALVVSRANAPPDCAARVIDRKVWRSAGSLALRRVGTRFEIVAARPQGYDRPWARAVAESNQETAIAGRMPTPRDATPHADDLEMGD
jgi:competence protein ComEC